MREIKFRAWAKYGEMLPNVQNHIGNGEWAFGEILKSDNFEVMQFTGLKDKRGADIYEGDIFKSNKYPFYSDAPEMEGGKSDPVELNYLGVVGIDVDGAYYDLKVVSERVAGRVCGGQLSELEDIEVIGNIHENPELLE